MHEYFPILVLGAIIGVFTLIFLVVFLLEKNKKASMGFERHMKDGEIVRRLLRYAGPHKGKFVLVFFIMLFSIVIITFSLYIFKAFLYPLLRVFFILPLC